MTRHSFAQFGCAAFADNARTYAYHEWACATNQYPSECQVELFECACDLDDPITPYTNPIDDAAPWYDPNDPASGEFLGALIQDIKNISDSTIEREPTASFGDGTILNQARLAGRSFTFELILLSTSCRGADYGFEWLRRVLETELCGCGPDPCEGCYGKRLTIRKSCNDPTPCDTGLRHWESTGVVDGLKITSDPEATCCCVVQTVTFVMQSESPYSFGCEEIACNYVASEEGTFFDKCFDWIGFCNDDCCKDRDDNRPNKECDRCQTDLLCTCYGNDDPVPTSINTFNSCHCEPLVRRIQACCIDEIGSAGFDTALRMEIFSGLDTGMDADALAFRDLGLRNMRISIYDNPEELPCITDEESYDEWCASRPRPRFEVQIPYIPSNATLTIDGRSNRVFMECDGVCRPFPYAIDSMKGSLFPLVTRCEPMMATIEWDQLNSQIKDEPGKLPSAVTMTTYRRWLS